MNDVMTLLKPRLWSVKNNRRSKNGRGGSLKLLLLGAFGAIFWGGLFSVSLRVLGYFRGIEEIGDILAYKLLSMILITSFALLIFSSILTALSKLYLSKDLFLVHSLPVSSHKIFIARWIDSTIESSWMVVVYTLPVMIAYGIAYHTGFFFYLSTFASLVCLSVIASAISALLVMTAVIIIPASRMKTIFVFLGLSVFLLLYIAFRLLKPELLVDPEVFATVLTYVKALETPSYPYLPSTWAFDVIKASLIGTPASGWFHLSLLLSCACFLMFMIVIIADRVYFHGMSKTQTATTRLVRFKDSEKGFFNFLPGPIRSFTVKEIKTFFRDQTQWSQLFLIGALVVIYVYNFNVLPLDKAPVKTIYLQNLLAFLNMGLALFVLTAVTARFAYPAVSTEKESFWIVRSSPISIKSFLWIKFFIYYIPLLILTEILIIATNILLNVTPFMMILSTITVFFLVPGIVAMGIGIGAAYPDFGAENAAQTVTSYGGLLFMILCAGCIGVVLILEAGPVYKIFMSEIWNRPIRALTWVWIIVSFIMAFVVSILAFIVPMRFGVKQLSERMF